MSSLDQLLAEASKPPEYEITCPRCRKARADSLVRVQLRFDQPTRPLVRCLNCGYEWRTTSQQAKGLEVVTG